jgi:hypothetical protein
VEAARKALDGERRGLYDEVAGSVGRYYEGLAAAGIGDAELVAGQGDEGAQALRKLALLSLLPLALVGGALFWLPYQIPKLSTRLARGETDVVSTYKIGLGLVVFPAWTALAALLALLLLPAPWALPGALAVAALPFAVLPWLDELDRLQGADGEDRGEAAPTEEELRRRREGALAAINRARAEIGA